VIEKIYIGSDYYAVFHPDTGLKQFPCLICR